MFVNMLEVDILGVLVVVSSVGFVLSEGID